MTGSDHTADRSCSDREPTGESHSLRREAVTQPLGQVSWLSAQASVRAFPSGLTGQWQLRTDSPITVALPQRCLTAFPFHRSPFLKKRAAPGRHCHFDSAGMIWAAVDDSQRQVPGRESKTAALCAAVQVANRSG